MILYGNRAEQQAVFGMLAHHADDEEISTFLQQKRDGLGETIVGFDEDGTACAYVVSIADDEIPLLITQQRAFLEGNCHPDGTSIWSK